MVQRPGRMSGRMTGRIAARRTGAKVGPVMARPGSGTAVSRRALLASSLGASVALMTGCTSGNSPQTSVPSASTAETLSPSAVPNSDDNVAKTIMLIEAQLRFAVAVQESFPRLRGRYRSLLELHDAHLQFLNSLPGANAPVPVAPVPSVPISRTLSDQAMAISVGALAADLATQATASQDASLARALASLSAGVVQRGVAIGWATGEQSVDLPASATLTTSEQDALQVALARAHSGLWSYGVLGGQTSATRSPALFAGINAGYAAHRQQRDQLVALLTALGAAPVAAQPTYEQPPDLETPRQVAQAAQAIERDCAETYAWLVAQTQSGVRGWAAATLTNAAIRELAVQGTPENFPGADELADR